MLNLVKDFISKRKAKDQVLLEKYKDLHQPPRLQLKTLLFLRRYSASLSAIKKLVRNGIVYHFKNEKPYKTGLRQRL